MRRLSSKATFLYKHLLPVLALGLLAILWLFGLLVPLRQGEPRLPLILIPPVLGGLVYLACRRVLFGLLDEVWLDGDTLLLKNRRRQARVALAEVMNVEAPVMINPRRISLMLRNGSAFGREVSFVPAGRRAFRGAWQRHPLASELIERVDAARTVRA